MPTKILPDLVYAIVGHLHDDRSSLASCALVSTLWLSASRMQLWRVVSIDVDFDGFVDFLQECPHLCGYIRELSFVGEDMKDPDIESEVEGLIEKTILQSTTLCTILSALPQLRVLALQEIFFFESFSGFATTIQVGHRYQLDTLRLQNSAHISFSLTPIVEFFGLFSRIGKLLLDHVAWVPGTLEATAIPHYLQIHSIVVKPCLSLKYLSDITRLLSGTQSMRTLNSIEIHDTCSDEIMVLVGLIGSVGQNLVHLFFGISVSRLGIFSLPGLERMALKLESCPNLRCLELELFRVDTFETRIGCNFFLALLSRLPSSLRQLTLHFNSVHPKQLWEEGVGGVPTMEWKQVEVALSGSKSLERVILDFHVVDGLRHGIPRFRIDDITHSFGLQSPLLSTKGVFQLRMNTLLFNLSDGVKISTVETPRCAQKGCRRYPSDLLVTDSGWRFDLA